MSRTRWLRRRRRRELLFADKGRFAGTRTRPDAWSSDPGSASTRRTAVGLVPSPDASAALMNIFWAPNARPWTLSSSLPRCVQQARASLSTIATPPGTVAQRYAHASPQLASLPRSQSQSARDSRWFKFGSRRPPSIPIPSPSSAIARRTMSTAAAEDSKFRLPTNVRPTHYDVTVQTDLEKLTFSGFVKIKCVHSPASIRNSLTSPALTSRRTRRTLF